MQTKFSLTEKLVLLLVLLIVLAGFVLLFVNKQLFDRYIQEDGLVEWLTVIGLLLASGVCFARFAKLLRRRRFIFLAVNFVLCLLLFMAAGEEISWGQRIFNIKTPEYFQQHNLQNETNVHNLMINGIKINQVVFSLGLISALVIYLAVFPLLYRRKQGFKNWINDWGIALPQTYQIIAFGLLFGITSAVPHEKNAELLECGAGLLFFLMMRYPFNRAVLEAPVTQ